MSAPAQDRGPFLIVGPFPPPVHGLAAITEAMARAVEAERTVVRIDIAKRRASQSGAAPVYHLLRVSRVIGAVTRLCWYRARGCRSLYMPCSGGFGLVYDTVILVAARLLGLRRTAHHHSFHYIDRRSRLMAALVRVGGAGMTHVFLCERMRAGFERAYGPTRALILPNDIFVARPPARPDRADGPLRIGFLSNLTAEKGLPDFIDLIRAAAAEGLATGILAGPAEGENLAQIEAAGRDLGSALDFRGPVHGADKAQFFSDIDIFIFPTRYAHEAQPVVICEAMAASLPVLAYDRGCIAGQLGEALLPLDRTADFHPWALDHLRRLDADRAALTCLGAANAARAAAKAAEGAEALRQIAAQP